MHSESVPDLHAGFSGLSIPLQRGLRGSRFQPAPFFRSLGLRERPSYSCAPSRPRAISGNWNVRERRPCEVGAIKVRLAEQPRAVLDSVNAFHPMGRHGEPEDVVEAVLFLASEKNTQKRLREPRRSGGTSVSLLMPQYAHRRKGRRGEGIG